MVRSRRDPDSRVKAPFAPSVFPRRMKIGGVATVILLAAAVAANRGFLPNDQKPTPLRKGGRHGYQNSHFYESAA